MTALWCEMQNLSGYKLEYLLARLAFMPESLVAWLNYSAAGIEGRALRRVQERAARLIAALREINAIADSGDKSPEAIARGCALDAEIRGLVKPLSRTRWKLVPAVGRSTEDDYWHGWHLEPGADDDLRRMLGMVATLSQYGLLDSVRQCDCGGWFLAYNRRSKFHSLACKRKFESDTRKTNEGRSARAKYMRTLRDTKRRLKAHR